jgi:hypothetical protein
MYKKLTCRFRSPIKRADVDAATTATTVATSAAATTPSESASTSSCRGWKNALLTRYADVDSTKVVLTLKHGVKQTYIDRDYIRESFKKHPPTTAFGEAMKRHLGVADEPEEVQEPAGAARQQSPQREVDMST